MVGMASPRFAIYISVPGAATGGASLAVVGIEALAGCSCAAVAGLAVWASAVRLEDECEAARHPAAAKRRQEIPVMMRIDERRKRSSAKTYLKAIVAAGGVSR